MPVIHEPPYAAAFAGIGIPFAVVTKRSATNELPGVAAFVCGLFSANTALGLAMFFTKLAAFKVLRPALSGI